MSKQDDSDYDYDSQDELSGGVSKTSTFLGFVDCPISSTEQPDLEDTFIGGEPIWIHPDSAPKRDLLLCKNCSKPLHLLLQTYANLENTMYDRIIYVFGCNGQSCRRKQGTIRVLKGIKKNPSDIAKREKELKDYLDKQEANLKKIEEKQKQNDLLTKDLFTTGSSTSNPFGSNPFSTPDTSSSNPFATTTTTSSNPFETKKEEPKQQEQQQQQQKKETKSYAEISKPISELSIRPKSSVSPSKPNKLDIELPQYPGYILYVDQESLDPKKQQLPPIPETVQQSSTTDENDSGAGASSSSLNKPKLSAEGEELAKMLDDSTFQNFTNVLSYNPGQVLRYELNGKPLLYSSTDATSKILSQGKVPGGNSRRFELQIMPKAILDLEKDVVNLDILKDGMEWGTILVYTDVDDHIPDHLLDDNFVGYVEQWCGVQWEEEVGRL